MIGIEDINISELTLQPGSHLHFIGIGGSSMSGIAELALHRGYTVSGSDRAYSEATLRLKDMGAEIYIGHSADNIPANCSLVIYTLAISNDNPEYQKAHELGIPTIERGAFLGTIAEEYSRVAAIAGTHGKTSTTSMLASILINAKKDPNVHLGGISSSFNSNVRTGNSNIFVTEACEYHENFLHIHPQIGIILNVEAEHLDYFGDEKNVELSFNKFISGIKPDGVLVVCADSKLALKCAETANCSVITYSINTAHPPKNFTNAKNQAPVHHIFAANISMPENATFSISAGYSYDLYVDSSFVTNITLNVPGKHNVSNSLAAIATAMNFDCSAESLQEGLSTFRGAGRRFDVAGTYNGAFIINDYAHHPTEIEATIEAAKANCRNRVWSVFQPHTYSRALQFKHEFCNALKHSDYVIVTDIYAAREPVNPQINSEMLNKLFTDNGIKSVYIPDFEQISSFLKTQLQEGDAVLLLGAGTINKLSDLILK